MNSSSVPLCCCGYTFYYIYYIWHQRSCNKTTFTLNGDCTLIFSTTKNGLFKNIFDRCDLQPTVFLSILEMFSVLYYPFLVRLHDSISEEGFHYLVFDLWVTHSLSHTHTPLSMLKKTYRPTGCNICVPEVRTSVNKTSVCSRANLE